MYRSIAGWLCATWLIAVQAASGQPSLEIRDVGLDANGALIWQLNAIPDETLFSDTPVGLGGSLAIEVGLTLDGSADAVAKVASNWPYDNPGVNPFRDDAITDGVVVEDDRQHVFAALGSNLITTADPVPVLTLTAPGSVTTVSFGGQTRLKGTAFEYEGARVAQGGINHDGLSGSLTVLLGDYDRDIDVDSADLLTFLGKWSGDLPEGDPQLAYPDGDLTGDSDVDSADMLVVLGGWTGSRNAQPNGQVATIPEPGAAVLCCLAIPALMLMRRRRV